jgi:hypothetical protein
MGSQRLATGTLSLFHSQGKMAMGWAEARSGKETEFYKILIPDYLNGRKEFFQRFR